MRILFYFDDSKGAVMAADELRAQTGEDVVLYDVLACREAEKADAVEFLPDVPNCERTRIEALFGLSPSERAPHTDHDPLDHDGDGRKGGSLPKLAVGKGPGGRFYVKRGKEIISGPYGTEDEANEAKAREPSA